MSKPYKPRKTKTQQKLAKTLAKPLPIALKSLMPEVFSKQVNEWWKAESKRFTNALTCAHLEILALKQKFMASEKAASDRHEDCHTTISALGKLNEDLRSMYKQRQIAFEQKDKALNQLKLAFEHKEEDLKQLKVKYSAAFQKLLTITSPGETSQLDDSARGQLFFRDLAVSQLELKNQKILRFLFEGVSHEKRNDDREIKSSEQDTAYGELLPTAFYYSPFKEAWQNARVIVDLGGGQGLAAFQIAVARSSDVEIHVNEIVKSRYEQTIFINGKLQLMRDWYDASSLPTVECKPTQLDPTPLDQQEKVDPPVKPSFKKGKYIAFYYLDGLMTKNPERVDLFLFNVSLHGCAAETHDKWTQFFKQAKKGCHVLSYSALPHVFLKGEWSCIKLSLPTTWARPHDFYWMTKL